MRIIKKFDKLLLLLGFLLVIAIFALAIVLYFKGGICAFDPCEYIQLNNFSCYNPYIIQP